MEIHIICAIAKNGVFGKGDGLPWPRFDRDFEWFKEQTKGHIIVMGAKTWNSLPAKLPNRQHVVIGKNVIERPHQYHANGWPDMQFDQVNDMAFTLRRIAMEHLYNEAGMKKVFVIGGPKIIEMAVKSKVVDSAFVTHVDGEYEHDAWMSQNLFSAHCRCSRVIKRLESVNGQPAGTIKEYLLEVR